MNIIFFTTKFIITEMIDGKWWTQLTLTDSTIRVYHSTTLTIVKFVTKNVVPVTLFCF